MGQFREVGVFFLHIVSSYLSNNLGSDGLKVIGKNILYLENKNSTLYVLQPQLEYVPALQITASL